ncbi:MAG: hypothetical protein Q8920_17695, partial [Bacillota bacterium]|nr:hypothetical protein [Bacillota bacterium]
ERLLVQYKGINSEKINDIECDFSYDDGEDHLITSDKLDESGCLKMNFGGTGEIINKGDVVDLTIKWDGRSEKVDLK